MDKRRRRMSRRVFFGVVVAPLAAKVAGVTEPGCAFSYTRDFVFENSVWREGGLLSRAVGLELLAKVIFRADKGLLGRVFAEAYKHPRALRVLDENGVTEQDFANPRGEPLQ